MILNETVAAIADAIREKTGKSDLIAPVNFAEEIKSISVGGSGESGGSTIEYLDVSGQPFQLNNELAIYADVVKGEGVTTKVKFVGLNDEMTRIASGIGDGVITYSAMAVDFSRKVKMIYTDEDSPQIIEMSIIEALTRTGISRDVFDSIPRISREQFYTLE